MTRLDDIRQNVRQAAALQAANRELRIKPQRDAAANELSRLLGVRVLPSELKVNEEGLTVHVSLTIEHLMLSAYYRHGPNGKRDTAWIAKRFGRAGERTIMTAADLVGWV